MKKKQCKYGEKCYRVNAKHREEYDHSASPPPELADDEASSALPAKLSRDAEEPEKPPPKAEKRKAASLTAWLINDFDDTKKTKPDRRENEMAVISSPKPEQSRQNNADVEPHKGNGNPDTSVAGVSDNSAAASEEPSTSATDMETRRDWPQKQTEKLKFIRDNFLFEPPQDFTDFWNFFSNSQASRMDNLTKAGLRLGGPLDFLARSATDDTQCPSKADCILHDRFYFDPPDFQTVFVGEAKGLEGFHVGYLRPQIPNGIPVLCSNWADQNGALTIVGDNIFAALLSSIKVAQKHGVSPENPEIIDQLCSQIEHVAKKHGHSLETNSSLVKKRWKQQVVARTLHKGGIVVPVVNDVGYRELPESDSTIRKMLSALEEVENEEKLWAKKLEPFENMLSLIQFANDEGDFGEGLELGVDMWFSGIQKLVPFAKHLMATAYTLLNVPVFAEILEVHAGNRRKSLDLKMF